MTDEHVSLAIDVFSASTLPMARLADYLKPFATLLGSEAHVHFDRVADGSAECRASVESHASPKIRERINGVIAGTAPRAAMKAHGEIDDLLLEDNAIGRVAINNRSVIEFPGRKRAPQETLGPVRRTSSIEGQVFLIGGKDDTINIYLNDGCRELRCVVSVELARSLGPHLRGPRIRFFGEGIWYRIDGRWEMKAFTADRFSPLVDISLERTIKSIQENFSGIDANDFLATMQGVRLFCVSG
jgi:hypothetical protein